MLEDAAAGPTPHRQQRSTWPMNVDGVVSPVLQLLDLVCCQSERPRLQASRSPSRALSSGSLEGLPPFSSDTSTSRRSSSLEKRFRRRPFQLPSGLGYCQRHWPLRLRRLLRRQLVPPCSQVYSPSPSANGSEGLMPHLLSPISSRDWSDYDVSSFTAPSTSRRSTRLATW